MKQKANYLDDVVVIRPILIFLLVFYHAFAIYNPDAWAPLPGFPSIRAYWWLDKLSYAFMLEMFVFGYVFGYQVRTKGKEKLEAERLFEGKFKRLIVPSIVFSTFYILFFGSFSKPIQVTLYDVANGVAHMWFLSMLFLCFTLLWAVEKSKIKSWYILAVSVPVAMVVPTDLPLQFGVTLYYFPFFYVGYLIQCKDISLTPLHCAKSSCLILTSFAILFPVLTLLREHTGMILGGVILH